MVKKVTDIESAWYFNLLICPDCQRNFALGDQLACSNCEFSVEVNETIDLRAKQQRIINIEAPVLFDVDRLAILDTIPTDAPVNTYSGPDALRDSSELMTELMQYCPNECDVLDLGCGPKDQARPVEYLGHRYVGVDYSSHEADFNADAHSLPFADNSFDCVLSYAVLEHLHNPFIALQEITRVLKPGGVYIGTVSQGEPFHASFFHHTAWGVLSLMSTSGQLTLKRLWATDDTLASLSRMGRYPQVIKKLLAGLEYIHQTLPFLAPRRMQWSDKEKQIDKIYSAGSLAFVMSKS